MKPAVDEMFPEGAGPYVDLDEVRRAAPGRAGAEPRPAVGRGPGLGREKVAACMGALAVPAVPTSGERMGPPGTQ